MLPFAGIRCWVDLTMQQNQKASIEAFFNPIRYAVDFYLWINLLQRDLNILIAWPSSLRRDFKIKSSFAHFAQQANLAVLRNTE